MHFKIDENLPIEVVELLTGHNHDAVSVEAQGLSGEDDPSIAAISNEEGRCLLTLDTDFADIRSYPPGSHSGIVVLRLARQDKNSVLVVVRRLLASLDDLSPVGVLWIVDERRIRVRGGQ